MQLRTVSAPPPPTPFGLQTVLKHWKLFLTVFATLFVLTAVGVMLLPKGYASETKLLVKNERQALVVSPERNVGAVRPSDLTDTQLNSEMELLRSGNVLRTVVMKTGLADPDPATPKNEQVRQEIRVDRAIAGLAKSLDISPIKKTDIISVGYSSKIPGFANTVLTTLVDTYLSEHLQVHGSPGTYAVFAQQADIYRDKLDHAEEKLRDFRQKNSILVMPDEKDVLTERAIEARASLEDIDAQIADYGQRVTAGHKTLGKLQPRVVTQIREVPDEGLAEHLNESLADLQNRRSAMLMKFRPDDRFVKEVDQEIAQTQSALAQAHSGASKETSTDINVVQQETERSVNQSEITLAGLLARRRALDETVQTYSGRMHDLAGAGVEADSLSREVKEDEGNYLLYATKREEARIAETLDKERITNVAVIQDPTNPLEPTSPKVKLDLVLGAVLAMLAALGAVSYADRLPARAPSFVSSPLVAAAGD